MTVSNHCRDAVNAYVTKPAARWQTAISGGRHLSVRKRSGGTVPWPGSGIGDKRCGRLRRLSPAHHRPSRWWCDSGAGTPVADLHPVEFIFATALYPGQRVVPAGAYSLPENGPRRQRGRYSLAAVESRVLRHACTSRLFCSIELSFGLRGNRIRSGRRREGVHRSQLWQRERGDKAVTIAGCFERKTPPK